MCRTHWTRVRWKTGKPEMTAVGARRGRRAMVAFKTFLGSKISVNVGGEEGGKCYTQTAGWGSWWSAVGVPKVGGAKGEAVLLRRKVTGPWGKGS